MAKRRLRRYSRRTAGQSKRSRVPALVLCVVIFLVLCIAISVVIGLLLGQKADEAAARPKYDFEKVEYQSGNKTVKSIEGYHFAKGANAYDYYMQDIRDFSFCLRHADGSLDHASEVAFSTGLDTTDEYTDLDDVVDTIHDTGGRACGYFYVSAFEEQGKELRQVYKAYELALISEMANSGIDEILLLGISVNDQNIEEVEQFLAKACLSADKTAIGAAISLDTLMLTEKEQYYAARVKNCCDFLALDAREMTVADTFDVYGEDGERYPSAFESMIVDTEYYIKTYKLRLVFSSAESSIYKTALAFGIVDFQIVGE